MKKHKKKTLIYFILSIIIFLSISYIIDYLSLKHEIKKETNLLNTIKIDSTEISEVQNNNTTITSETSNQNNNEIITNETTNQNNIPIKTEKMLKVKSLQEQNPDIVGWLEISGTSINYPVLQGTDNEYYMTHNYKKEKSKNGSIFLSKDYNWEIPSSNLLIYGHNMLNGTMFEELLKYSDKSFYIEHPIIKFTTSSEDMEFEIISILQTRVFYKSEKNVFRYYNFVNAENEYEYNEFIQNAKKESLYDIPTTAKYGDQLITLSTCSYHVQDGRFAVIGRKK